MNKVIYSTLFILLLVPAMFSHSVQAEEAVVEKIESGVEVLQYPSPEKVTKRMEKSIQTIGEHILLGRKTGEITVSSASYERLIKEVFDRVLVGYSVDHVRIVPGATTQVIVTVAPWGDTVREVDVHLDIAGLSPEAAQLVRQEIGNLNDKFSDVLVGLPVEAVDWASGIAKSLIREMLSDQLPEFRANFEVVSGAKTVVNLTLVPVGLTVQNVSVVIHSKSIPNFLLLEAKPTIERSMELLRGLPVEFVERHKDFFLNRLTASVAAHPVTSRYGLSLVPLVKPGIDTQIVLDVETNKYKVWLEGYLDMNRNRDNTSIKGHVGKAIGKQDELFTEITFVPGSVKWIIEPGWSHQFTPATALGLKYQTSDWNGTIFIKQQLTPAWSLRLERVPELHHNEVGIRYRIHDFLSAEYIISSDENWFRLVGNL